MAAAYPATLDIPVREQVPTAAVQVLRLRPNTEVDAKRPLWYRYRHRR